MQFPFQSSQQQFQQAVDRDVQADNSRYELDFDDVINSLRHSLNSEEQQIDGTWVIPPNTKPKLNRTGVNDMISDFKTVMHKGIPLGNIDIAYAKLQSKKLGYAFGKKLVRNKEKWGVDISQRPSLVLMYAQSIYLTLTRPIGDKERSHRSKRISFKEGYNHDEVNPNEIGGL